MPTNLKAFGHATGIKEAFGSFRGPAREFCYTPFNGTNVSDGTRTRVPGVFMASVDLSERMPWPDRNSVGPIWSKKMNGPIICLAREGKFCWALN